ncbi:uncharacterized protein C8A04DRAFT_10188 [Dichotomopilus funicola]|uniref:Uncharacterized protein n=1 Tax=Dichotomopilus funicola TaxID=1934379 RepID=A0AAN6ZR00_9PEZI|nr:hypothetical protein C8A04DRAFT_10188 [Dichotomopilus funicola]
MPATPAAPAEPREEKRNGTNTIGDTTLLQSKEHRDLLDVIDRLRSQGLSRFVDLPQIIVCGDQSSGKSSALEAISGMSFPTKDNLCTRFATELILRRSPKTGVAISIRPGADRTDEEKKKLKAFKYKDTLENLDLGRVVEEAKSSMGLNNGSSDRVFSADVLCVEISGPSQPHLTMVDLPGLFLAGNKDQSQTDAALVESLVLSYMKNRRTIILAVVSAKSDFALQQVTSHARKQDPDGTRTLGLITKPDTLDKGSESERYYIDLAQNRDVHFQLGWHVLRNRGFSERCQSSGARDAAEAEFFSTDPWKTLQPSQMGVGALRTRLSNVLRGQIVSQLPDVLADIAKGIEESNHTLQKLGDSRATLRDQRQYLITIGSEFMKLAKEAVDGGYTDPFFEDSDHKDRRLRAVIQNTLSDFARDMRLKGHSVSIAEGSEPSNGKTRPPTISRAAYIEKVKKLMMENRGRELPGTYNPMLVAQMFREQCQPWEAMVDSLLTRTFHSATRAVAAILLHVADKERAASLSRTVVGPLLQRIQRELRQKAEEVLRPHISGHPITYNHYLTDNVQRAQSDRRRARMEQRMKSFFKAGKIPDGIANHKFDMSMLLSDLVDNTEPDMDTYSCSMAVDTMEAYYKVSQKTLIDSISTLAIEAFLMKKLPSLLSPKVIYELPDSVVERIAAESPESVAERAQAGEKLAVLEAALSELRRMGIDGDTGGLEVDDGQV